MIKQKKPDDQTLNRIRVAFQDDLSRDLFEFKLARSLGKLTAVKDVEGHIEFLKRSIDDLDRAREIIPTIPEFTRNDMEFIDKIGETLKTSVPISSRKTFKKAVKESEFYRGLRNFINESLPIMRTKKMRIDDKLERMNYFCVPEFYPVLEREVFIDCGCFDGLSSRRFVEFCGEGYEHIFAFEPIPQQAVKCQKHLKTLKSTIIQAGVSDVCGEANFTDMLMGSQMSEQGTILVRLTTIDTELKGVVPTFIKMDIEGAEMQALRGAKHAIESYLPRLAICIYHLPEDVWEVPEFILNCNPNYRFIIRHPGLRERGTVLYAYIPANKN